MIVLARNFRDYDRWRKENNIRPGETIYVLDASWFSEWLMGRKLRASDFVELPDFDLRDDAEEIRMLIGQTIRSNHG